MKSIIKCLCVNTFLSSILLFASVMLYAQEQNKYISYWQGIIKNGGQELTINLKVFKEKEGKLNAVMESVEQGTGDLPTSDFYLGTDSLRFKVPLVNGIYSGKIVSDSNIIRGFWKQGPFTVELNFKKVDEIEKPKRPQLPQKPYPYNEEEVSFQNKQANITLAGSFTFPKSGSSFPAVVLISGSGPQDRDETIFNHKPFLVIADYLTRNGIAVLRFDDRGVGKSQGNYSAATTAELAQDALSAVEYLKSRKEVNPKKIGLIGHSEGGLIASMIASSSNDISFIVLLASPGLPGKDILLMQQKLIAQAQGVDEKTIEENFRINEKMYDIVLSEPDSDKAVEKLNKVLNDYVNTLPSEKKGMVQFSEEGRKQMIKVIMSPWFRFFLKYDPRPALESIFVPVLALNGSKDLQVSAKANLTEIEKALTSGGNKHFEVKELPGLNHLFQNCDTGSPTEYAKIEETFSPAALKIIGDWILKVTNNK
ncbi:alpha/beta hydrolase family protein [Melioribacteraceae bacterium 4301-Me]|uniref:alpha/beta hydrolase family protein n=1 Tax=Pyranulibacter aquaticus TaxID=3163344 RepID=UPI00359A0328